MKSDILDEFLVYLYKNFFVEVLSLLIIVDFWSMR